jgi:hypothetical protein
MPSIEGKDFVSYQVAPDGTSFQLNFRDREGRPASLTLPSDCLNALVMTLPHIASQAMQAQYRDDSMRLVHPVGAWRLESSTAAGRMILTLQTPDHFEVSFMVTRQDLAQMLATAKAKPDFARPDYAALN